MHSQAPGEGATEFVLGSHRVNLSAQGLTTGVFSCLTLVGNLAPFFIGLAVNSGGYELPDLLAYSIPLLYAGSAAAFVAAAQLREREGRAE